MTLTTHGGEFSISGVTLGSHQHIRCREGEGDELKYKMIGVNLWTLLWLQPQAWVQFA